MSAGRPGLSQAEARRGSYRSMVHDLLRVLTVEELAPAVGVRERQVRHWAAGDHAPYGRARERLEAVSRLVGALYGAYSEAGARAWLHWPNNRLGGRSPVDALADGEHVAVVEAARHLPVLRWPGTLRYEREGAT